MKKRSIVVVVCSIALVSVMLFGGLGVVAIGINKTVNRINTEFDRYEVDFFPNKESFEVIVTALLDITDKKFEKDNAIYYATVHGIYSDGRWEIEYSDAEFQTVDVEYVYATEQQKAALEDVHKAFPVNDGNGGLWFITIKRDRVIFHATAPYNVVYMKNGKKPDYINAPNESFQYVYIKKLSKHWYHGAFKSYQYFAD